MQEERREEDPIAKRVKEQNRVAIQTALATKESEGVCLSHAATVEVGVAGLKMAETSFDLQRTSDTKLDALHEKISDMQEHRELSVKLLKAVVALLGALGGVGGLVGIAQLVGCSQ